MNVLDLFSGIGCFSLGLERAGMQTIAFCEVAPFPRAVLGKHWPDIPCYGDIRTFRPFSADVVCGGFPCQPFSTASRGRRVAIDLWPEMRRIVERARPAYVIGENVQEEAIANAARDLAGLGYGTYYRRISGADAGADHQRDRWWVVAYPHTQGELRSAIDAEVAKLPALCAGLWGPGNYARAVRVLDGPADRMDRVGALGNAVIPQIPEAIGRAIMKQSKEALYQNLLHKYSHVGCPAAHYEDNCDRPGACAENGRCLDLESAEPTSEPSSQDRGGAMIELTPEQRYRQACRKAQIIGQRNLRKFMAGELGWLPCSDPREFIIAEIGRAFEAGRASAVSRPPQNSEAK